VFAPSGGLPQSRSSAAGGEKGETHHAGRANGCVFSGASAKFNGRPTAAGLVLSGGWSLTVLLAITCALLGLSSLSQWVRSEARWWIG
jgi:hypothetical protein